MALPTKEGQGDKELFLDILTKEEKEALLTQKMEAIRKKNRVLQKRHAEIEADKKAAEKFGGAVVLKSTPQSDRTPERQGEKLDKRATWGPDKFSHAEMKGVPDEGPKESKLSGGRGKRLAQMSQEKLRAKDYENEQKSQSLRDKKPGQRDPKAQRPLSVDGPPPDPSYNFLSDRMRDANGSPPNDKKYEDSARRHPRNFGGQSFDGVKAKMKYEKGRAREAPGPRNTQEMEVQMTGKERRDYQDWKSEREKIDKERLNRHRNQEGDWRREWDHNKIDQPDIPLPPASRHLEPNKRPVGRIGSGRFSLSGDERPKGESQRDKNSNEGNRWVFGQKPAYNPRRRSDDKNDEKAYSHGKESGSRGPDTGARGTRGGSNRMTPRSSGRVRVVSHSSTGSDEPQRQIEEQNDTFVIHVENNLTQSNQGQSGQRRGRGGRGTDRGRGKSEGRNWRDRSPPEEGDTADDGRWKRAGSGRGRGRGRDRGNDRFRNRGGDPRKPRPMSDSFDLQNAKAALSPDAPEFHPSGNLHLGSAKLDDSLELNNEESLSSPGKNPQVPPFTPGVKWSPNLVSTMTVNDRKSSKSQKSKSGVKAASSKNKDEKQKGKSDNDAAAAEDDDDDDEWEDEEEVEYFEGDEVHDEEIVEETPQTEPPQTTKKTVKDEDDNLHDSSSESFERFIEEHTLKIDIEAAAAAMGSLQPVTPPSATLSQDSGFKTPLDHEHVPDWGVEMEGKTPVSPGTPYGAGPLSQVSSSAVSNSSTESQTTQDTVADKTKESPENTPTQSPGEENKDDSSTAQSQDDKAVDKPADSTTVSEEPDEAESASNAQSSSTNTEIVPTESAECPASNEETTSSSTVTETAEASVSDAAAAESPAAGPTESSQTPASSQNDESASAAADESVAENAAVTDDADSSAAAETTDTDKPQTPAETSS